MTLVWDDMTGMGRHDSGMGRHDSGMGRHDSGKGRHDFGEDNFRATKPVIH